MSPAIASKPVLNRPAAQETTPAMDRTSLHPCWASDTRTAMDLALRSSGRQAIS